VLHSCTHSFSQLADEILPDLMAKLQGRMTAAPPLRSLSDPFELIPNARGTYVWMISGNPIYVGITNQLRRRVRDHVAGDPSRANLAVRMAANALGTSTSQVKRHVGFKSAFGAAREALMDGAIAYLEIENSMVLYLFEPYCAMELDTAEFNRFDTLQILSPRTR